MAMTMGSQSFYCINISYGQLAIPVDADLSRQTLEKKQPTRSHRPSHPVLPALLLMILRHLMLSGKRDSCFMM